MSLPLIAAQTYDSLKESLEVRRIVKSFTRKISAHRDPIKRARFVHEKINQSIDKLFEDEAVQKHVKCKKGCNACCHTQVSVTQDEAKLLARLVVKLPDFDLAKLIEQAEAEDNISFSLIYHIKKEDAFFLIKMALAQFMKTGLRFVEQITLLVIQSYVKQKTELFQKLDYLKQSQQIL